MWLRLIGPPCLFSATGQPNRLATKKQIALLVYLNHTSGGRGVRRDEVIELLWPLLTSVKGRQSLSQALSEIRNRLGKNAVTRGGTHVSLLQRLATDVSHLEYLELAPDSKVTALEGLEDVAGADFAHWVEASRVAITKDLHRKLNTEIDHLRVCGDRLAVRERASQLYEIDPVNVRAVSILAEAAAHGGETENAMSLIEAVMARKTDWDRVDLTTLHSLKERLKSTTGSGHHSNQVRRPHVLVGRQDELRRMHAATSSTSQTTHKAILVTGPPGVGKSLLTDRFTSELEVDGGFCLRTICRNASDTNAIARSCIRTLAKSTELGSTDPDALAELSRIAPFLRKTYPGIPKNEPNHASTSISSIVNAFVQAVQAVTSRASVILWVEDIDHIDPPSFALLQALLADPLPFQFTLVATCSKDHDAASVPRYDDVNRLVWTDTLALSPLTPAASRELIHVIASSSNMQLAASTTEQLVRWSHGFPLLTHLALSDLSTNKAPVFCLNHRIGESGRRWEPTPHVRAELERRFSRLWSEAGEVVTVLSLCNRPLTAECLHRVTTCTEERVRKAIEIGIGMGVLESVEEGFVFPDGILKAFAASRISMSSWVHGHRVIAKELAEQFGGTGDTALEAVAHFRAAGDAAAAARFSRRIARHLLGHGKTQSAERVLKESLQTDGEEQSTHLLLARIISIRGHHAQARRALVKLDVARLTESERATRDFLLAEADVRLIPRRLEDTKSPMAPLGADSEDNSLLLAGEAAACQRDWAKLRLITKNARDAIRATPPEHHLVSLAFCQMALGLHEHAVQNFQRSAVLLAHKKRILLQARALNGIGACSFALGRFSAAIAAFKNGYELAKQLDNASFAAAIASNLAATYTDYDFPRKAEWWLERSSPALDSNHSQSRYRFSVLANHVDHGVTYGHKQKASDTVEHVFAEPLEAHLIDPHLGCARADLLISTGNWDAAMNEVARVETQYNETSASKVPRFMTGFDSPHLARLMYLKAWHRGERDTAYRMTKAWPNATMSVAQHAELFAVFGWSAETDDPMDRGGTAHRYYERAARLVQHNGLTGVLRRLGSLGILGNRLRALAG